MKRLSRRLIEKSQDSFILGLENYNKLTIEYRVESFCLHFCNAWELLLKAKILESTKKKSSIYYKKKRNQPRRSISLMDCLRSIYPDENNPIRQNIEEIKTIRDEATHLIVRELEGIYSYLFQAGVWNYVRELNNWFGRSMPDRCSPAMMALLCDVPSLEPTKLRKAYGKEVADFVMRENTRIVEKSNSIQDNRYCISVEFKLVLTSKPEDADIVLTKGPIGEDTRVILKGPADPNQIYPYRTKDIVEAVRRKLQSRNIPPGVGFNRHDFFSIVHMERIKGNPRYHMELKNPTVHKYAGGLVDFIFKKIEMDRDYLRKARDSYKERLRP